MASEQLHLIVVDEGEYGWSLSSPQVPGFAYGRQTLEEFSGDMDEALAFAGAPAISRVLHRMRRFTSPEDVSYVIQVADTLNREDRMSVVSRLTILLEQPEHRSELLARSTTQTGDVEFICALSTDRIGWLADQTFEGDAVSIVAPKDDSFLWIESFTRAPQRGHPDERTIEELGLTMDNTLLDLMVIADFAEPALGEHRSPLILT